MHEPIEMDNFKLQNQEKRSGSTPPMVSPDGISEPAISKNIDKLVQSIDTLPNGGLQVLNGPYIGKIIPLKRSLLRVGLSGNECAALVHRSDGYYISHLEGDRPPQIDGKSIGVHTQPIRPGSIIQIGDTRLRFYEEISQADETWDDPVL